MLLDLGRSDLGRVCDRGTVQEKFMDIERYSHVFHIVSTVLVGWPLAFLPGG